VYPGYRSRHVPGLAIAKRDGTQLSKIWRPPRLPPRRKKRKVTKLREMRGAAIAEDEMPIILVNGQGLALAAGGYRWGRLCLRPAVACRDGSPAGPFAQGS
jgi:hypothetical protein